MNVDKVSECDVSKVSQIEAIMDDRCTEEIVREHRNYEAWILNGRQSHLTKDTKSKEKKMGYTQSCEQACGADGFSHDSH